MKLQCKGGPHDGLIVDLWVDGTAGCEYRVYGRTHNGRFSEFVYKLAFEGDGEKWIPFLDFFATDTYDAESCERIERKLAFTL